MAAATGFQDYAITDAEAYAAVLRGADVEMTQLASGTLRGHHTRMGSPEGRVSWVETNLPLRGGGRFQAGIWNLTLVAGARSRSFQHGIPVRTGTLFAHAPESEHDGIYGRDFSGVCVSLRRDRFVDLVNVEFPEVSSLLEEEWRVSEPRRDERRALLDLFGQAAAVLRSDERVRSSPAALSALRSELLAGFLGTLARAKSSIRVPTLERAAALVRRSEDLVGGADDHTLNVGDLCAGCDVPRRTLSLAFHKVLGMGPATYLRRLRLNRARRVLMEREPGGGTIRVARVALDHGFWHLGRFSAQYRELFGESPRASARRSGALEEPLA